MLLFLNDKLKLRFVEHPRILFMSFTRDIQDPFRGLRWSLLQKELIIQFARNLYLGRSEGS